RRVLAVPAPSSQPRMERRRHDETSPGGAKPAPPASAGLVSLPWPTVRTAWDTRIPKVRHSVSRMSPCTCILPRRGGPGEKAGLGSARHLIGRDNDLRSVRAAITEPGLTSVLGSPGLGKTALVITALSPGSYRKGGALRSLV